MAKPKDLSTKKEIGSSGVNIFHGVITGEEYNPDLIGRNGLTTYDEMRRSDPKVRQSLWAVKYPVVQSEWFFNAGGESEKDLLIKDFVKHNLFELIQWSTTLEQFLTYLEFGYCVNEMVFTNGEYEGRTYKVLDKVAYRKALSILNWQQQDSTPGVTQLTATKGEVSIPEANILRFTNQQEGENYEGVSILRTAYKPWFQKQYLEKIEMIGYDRQALGVPYAKYPTTASDKDKDKVEKLLREMRANEQAYIMTPIDWEHGWTESSGTVVMEIKNAINEKNSAIMSNTFSDFLDIGKRSSGSRSTSEDHSRFFELAVTAVADYIRDIVNLKLIPTLVDANFETETYPTIEHSKLGDENLPVLSEAVSKFAAAGAIKPRPEDENTIRKLVGLPELTDEEIEEQKQQAEETRQRLNVTNTDQDEEDENVKATAVLDEARRLHTKVTKVLYDQGQAA